MIDNKTGIIGDLYKVISRLKALGNHKIVGFDRQADGIILHEQQAIYFPIPKVACSSLKLVCAELLGIDTSLAPYGIHSVDFPMVKGSEISQFNNYWKFCFVRNPWDRILSCYKEKIKHDETFTGRTNSFVNGVHKGLLKYGVFKAKMTFEEFAIAVGNIPDINADPHFRSQHTFITNEREELLVDFIGKFENLERDWSYICDRLGLTNISLPHSNKTQQGTYREYYTNDSRRIIEKRFEREIAMFKYDF